jgi:hypothetical protein
MKKLTPENRIALSRVFVLFIMFKDFDKFDFEHKNKKKP